MSYIEYSLAEIAEKIRKREVSIEEVVRESLDRCRAIRKYNAFISLYEEKSMQIARAYDSLLDAGYTLGPLHGVPIVIKDNIAMAGTITTAGSKVLADNLTPEDATVVQKLKGAGAIIIGKTNMHEFAAGITSSNAHYGFARNPWDYSKNPAGSSGGTGAAVAARAAFGGLGTDTGGSVRLPALPFTALSIDDPIEQEDPLGEGLRYTGIPSITGKPALDIPAGFDSEGMPVGIMLIADSFRERLLFRVGSAFQQATDFHKKAPVMDHLLHAASFATDA